MWIRMIYRHKLENVSGYTAWVKNSEHFREWLDEREISSDSILELWIDEGDGYIKENVNVGTVA